MTDQLTQCGADAGTADTPGDAVGKCQKFVDHEGPHVDKMGVRWETTPGRTARTCSPPAPRDWEGRMPPPGALNWSYGEPR